MNTNIPVSCEVTELGPIKNARIDFNRLMFFTGNSNLGKSYVAFLAYYLFSVLGSDESRSFFVNKIKQFKESENYKFKFKISDFRLWMNTEISSFIGSLIGDESFRCNVNFIFPLDSDLEFNMSLETHPSNIHFVNEKSNPFLVDTYLIRINEKIEKKYHAFWDKDEALANAFSRHLFELLFGNEIPSRTIILPPARAALMGANYTLKEAIANVGMYRKFIKDYELIQRGTGTKSESKSYVENAISRLINGSYVVEKDELFIKLKNGKKLPISAAASSVKELSPLLLMLEKWKMELFSVLFEEPEAHLHPYNQSIVADLIARSVNNGAFFQITTHSDYFLTRVNQLIRIGNLRKKSSDLFKQFCNEERHSSNLYIDTQMVSSYYFHETDNGNIIVEKNEIDNGIPFSTFSRVVSDQYEFDKVIEDYLEME